jgi:eukaryotic-like serine/threonine-protein kinase
VQSRSEPPQQRAPQSGERSAPGTLIGGRYALRTAIGHGGMGTVWRAADTLLRRDVAVKEVLLPPGIAASDREQMYQRTLREARAAAALSHPSVVQVYDVVTEGGRPWIVMELLQSRSLAEMIIEDGPLAARAVAKIGIALLGALEVAHAGGVLHRDVKPANVLICGDGRCVLTDFGVARMPADAQLTTPGMVLGSPHFISPERAIGAKFGPPSDMFSLGVTLYTAVEGQPPFDKRDPFETMRAIVEEAPATPMRAGSLTGVLYGLLEKDPARRWDVHATRRVLRELLAGPLASASAAHVTDPYAVVRPAPFPKQAPPPVAAGQIGGRAMLAPGESVSSAIRRRTTDGDEPEESATGAENSPSVAAPTGGYTAPDALQSTGAYTPPDVVAKTPTQRGSSDKKPDEARTTQVVGFNQPGTSAGGGQYGTPVATHAPTAPSQYNPYGQQGQYDQGQYDQGQYTQPVQYGQPDQYGLPQQGAYFGQPAQKKPFSVRDLSDQGVTAFRRLPRWGQAAAAAGLVVVLVLGVGMAAGWFSDSPAAAPPPVAKASPSPSVPAFPTTEYRDDRGFVVNVPTAWTKKAAGTTKPSYIDFVDPADEGRKLRINVESASTPEQYMETAEKNLKKGTANCPAPYTRIDLRTSTDIVIDSHPAAELEYTCGPDGDQMRHGLWRAFVLNGKAYSFFVSVQASRFADSKAIYQEMVRSYHLTA